MKIKVEIEVEFDDGFDGSEVDVLEVSDEICSAVSACEGIENVGNVSISKIKIVWAEDAQSTLRHIARKSRKMYGAASPEAEGQTGGPSK